MRHVSPSRRWLGTSPAGPTILGVLTFVAAVGWRYFESRGQGELPNTHATASVRASPHAEPPGSMTSAIAQYGPAADTGQTHPKGVDPDPLPSAGMPESEQDQVLGLVAQALERQARLAVSAARVGVYLTAHHDDSASLKIADAERALADLQSSLDEARSRYADFSEIIDQVLGNTTALSEFDAALGQLGTLLGGRSGDVAELQTAAQQLNVKIIRADAWITGCDQRIASFKASAENAS